MPATIYKKHYDKKNMDLPIARYESDVDALVFVAIRHDDINGIRSLLDYSKRNINKPNAQGETPLIVAVNSNAFNAVRLLIGRHADATATDKSGLTALQHAQQNGNTRITRILQAMANSGTTQMAKTTTTTGTINGSPLQLIKPSRPEVDVN